MNNLAESNALAFHLIPHNHLVQLEDGGWDAIGNDPVFHCVGTQFPLPPGWYDIELTMSHIAGPAMWAYLYPDYGNHLLEPDKVFLPFVSEGASVHRGIVLFTHEVKSLRFDPAVTVCRFKVEGLRATRVSKVIAARAMLNALIMGRAPLLAKISMLGSLAGSLVSGGSKALARRLYDGYAARPEGATRVPYQTWIELYDPQGTERSASDVAEVALLAVRPTFSIILPVYNTPEKWLRKCIASVQRQAYEQWELCIANDASTAPHLRPLLDAFAAEDMRIKVVHRAVNGHISASSNSAIDLASGDWLVLLDHDDELHQSALLEVAKAIEAHPRWRLIYSDEDKIDEKGVRYDPYMKPDWNYDLFLSHNCVSHLGVYDAALVKAVGGFREGMEGSQDWDLALRCVEKLASDEVGHIPHVLYHWRAIPGSTAFAPQEKDYAHFAGMRTIDEHLARISSSGKVEEIDGQRGNYRVRYPVPVPQPLVSILVPTRDRVDLLRACVESIIEKTKYENYEIVVVDNQSSDLNALDYLASVKKDQRIRVVPYDAPFNYSALNNQAAREAKGEVLCLLNNDITVISRDWLDEMVGHACRPGVGAVGAMLYYPNDTIQHAGVIVGAHGIAAHAYSGHCRGYPGHMSRARLAQSMSAVTAACLVVRKTIFQQIGGLDPKLKVAFNDIDFCLRLREVGYRNIWTPFAELYHHESASRGYEDSPEKQARFDSEVAYMRHRWAEMVEHDPSHSPNHSVTEDLHQLSFPPRTHASHQSIHSGARRYDAVEELS